MESLSRLTSRQLISKGVEFVRADSLTDRAIACFSIVSNRYLENPEDTAVRRTATEALRHLGNIYMARDIDYKKAYRSLTLARQIAEEDGNDKIKKDSKLFLKSASEAAIRSNNSDIISAIIINIAISGDSPDNWGEYTPIIESFKRYFQKKPR